jgi:hypothetical protein
MGANAQTSVPLFVANTVLTASQQNISAATGIPVFATTVTRDAAFGGSNKVLAEGQLCYLESTDVVQYYTGAAWATVGPIASKVAQVLSSFKSDTFTMSSSTFADVTGLTVSITPSLNTSKIYVVASVTASQNVGTNNGFLRLARGGTAIAVGDTAGTRVRTTNGIDSSNGNFPVNSSLTFLDSPATTSATTYSVQIANNGSSSVFVNRSSTNTDGASYGSYSSTITVMEILA